MMTHTRLGTLNMYVIQYQILVSSSLTWCCRASLFSCISKEPASSNKDQLYANDGDQGMNWVYQIYNSFSHFSFLASHSSACINAVPARQTKTTCVPMMAHNGLIMLKTYVTQYRILVSSCLTWCCRASLLNCISK
jgi:hypothetical protein